MSGSQQKRGGLMRQSFLLSNGQMADNINVVIFSGDVCPTDQVRGLDAGAGRISLLLGQIGLA